MTEPNYTPGDLDHHQAVAIAIPNAYGQYLVLQHVKFDFWTIPLGKFEPGQDVTDCVANEVLEELSIRDPQVRTLGHRVLFYRREKAEVRVELHLVEVASFVGSPQNAEPEKHAALAWMSLDDLARLPRTSDGTLALLDFCGLTPSRALWTGSATPLTPPD